MKQQFMCCCRTAGDRDGETVSQTDVVVHNELSLLSEGNLSDQEVLQVLIDLRNSMNSSKWGSDFLDLQGWNELEGYNSVRELGKTLYEGLIGIKLDEQFILWEIGLYSCNLVGELPLSLAKLDTLVKLNVSRNRLTGSLPPRIGTAECLPSLKELMATGNPDLGGIIEPEFLTNCDLCDVSGCNRKTMVVPFLSGVTLSSNDIPSIFACAPKEVVTPGRLQGQVTTLYPLSHESCTGAEMNAGYKEASKHLMRVWEEKGSGGTFENWLEENNSSWTLWQAVWLAELRKIHTGYLFVFCTRSFQEKYLSQRYTEGGKSVNGVTQLTGEELCQEVHFNRGYGLANGELASSILDWERRHLEAASVLNHTPIVFMSCGAFAAQIERPDWYGGSCFGGIQAPKLIDQSTGLPPGPINRGQLAVRL
jgi:hypothetical protein